MDQTNSPIYRCLFQPHRYTTAMYWKLNSPATHAFRKLSIDQDYSEIDITNSDLSQRHRDFILPESPTETKMSDEEPVFSGTFRLCGLGAISDTLVGRGRWGNAETIHLVNLLFGPDENAAWKYIQSWRENAFAQYVATFDRMVEAEKVTYGYSFFNRKEAGLSTKPAFTNM